MRQLLQGRRIWTNVISSRSEATFQTRRCVTDPGGSRRAHDVERRRLVRPLGVLLGE